MIGPDVLDVPTALAVMAFVALAAGRIGWQVAEMTRGWRDRRRLVRRIAATENLRERHR